MNTSENLDLIPDYQNASGQLKIPLINDYLFRALMQENNEVLKSLIASLLHMSKDQVKSAKILNPIILGSSVSAKDIILDVKVELNNCSIINLEMQVLNKHNWPDRSLYYVFRSFEQLKEGEEYTMIKSVYQISILDFALFPEEPEFYAQYLLTNVKTYRKYSDKLQLYVLDLRHINLATDEDKQYRIDSWARLFKATTWEELKELAKSAEEIEQAVSTVYELMQDNEVRYMYLAREEFNRRMRMDMYDRQQAERERNQAINERNQALDERNQAERERNQALDERNQALDERNRAERERNQALDERNQALAELARLRQQLAEFSS